MIHDQISVTGCSMNQSYYRYHVFFCTNQRQDGSQCCQNRNARAMRDYVKERVKALGKGRAGGIRINIAGCMDRCSEGPVLVVYPEAVWYTYVDREDIDEIVEEHLVHGRVVERLRI
jgi:(2Fe-2S) ferredoxin